ncbi:MAG TPA: penicillin-binding protein 1C [Myxococcales bacterium]|nr:penicillin-binding protein 1C [Myxococcales bacterium]
MAAGRLVPLPARLSQPGSAVIEFRDGSYAHVFLSPDDRRRIAIARGEVDPAYLEALVRFEDKRFWYHPGIDPLAVARAAVQNARAGEVVSGGSTLTLQLVRVLEPRPRTLRSKVVEALRAVQLELRLSKAEILEAYLQFAPYGRNVEGVEAAALSYFGHTARSLSAAEIATLLAVPQDPARRSPSPANAARLKAARDAIAGRLWDAGALPRRGGAKEAMLAEIAATPAPAELRPFPRLAPHAAAYLHGRQPWRSRVRTTLDAGAQRLAEQVALRAAPGAADRGIHNGALVLVDHATGEVRALVGNFDFFDAGHGGQIPGFDRPRSTGSALKPFLFAEAIDDGRVLPETMVADVPTQFGTYAPRNYDGTYSGVVRLEDALTFSLNIPFVRLLDQVGVERFAALLRAMGATSLRDEPGYYGLSAIIGGMELTPLEMAGLYATLAEDGELRVPRLLPEAPEAAPQQVFSRGAAFLTRKALARRNRPDFPDDRRLTGVLVPIHWKTGTSFGHRDAWAAGSGPTLTAVVWLGNLDNSAAAGLVGASAAGPLLFDLLEAAEPRGARPPPELPPPGLRQVEVCALSGHLATGACPLKKMAWARSDRVPTARCPFHVNADVDDETGLQLNASCRAGRSYTTASFVVWPPDVRRWMRSERAAVATAPSLAPGCQAAGGRDAPRLVHPPAGQGIVLVPGLPPERQEVPLQADAASEQLSWFVDGTFAGTHPSEERVWWTPSPGEHEVVVVDEAGLSARRAFWVR